MSYTYLYPRPSVTTDIIVYNQQENAILLIKRGNEPFKDQWALPGGFVDENEPLILAAKRELHEETDIEGLELIQFAAYGDPGRDPRGHCVSIVFYHIHSGKNQLIATAGDDAKECASFDLNDLPKLAFDHQNIMDDFICKIINPPLNT